MPLNEIPKHFSAETRSVVEAALEDAWQELCKDGNVEEPARKKAEDDDGSSRVRGGN